MKKIAITLAILTLMSSATLAQIARHGGGPAITDIPDVQLRVHSQSNIDFSVTNFGVIGSQGGNYPDEEGNFSEAPGAEFPPDSDIDYLFQGALWAGAITDLDGDPNTLDTLVSTGNDGWWEVMELLPPPEGDFVSMWRDSTMGDEEIWSVFFDTTTDPQYVLPDPNEIRPHIPLGLQITRQSIGWRSPVFNELFILNYYIENIYDRELNDLWIGLFYDGDVFYRGNWLPGEEDDICGFTPYQDHGLAWIIDNDGDVISGGFDYRSPRGIMAMQFLGSSQGDLDVNFNWWISNVNAAYDWGPQLQENYQGQYPGGGLGTPGGDAAKYRVMSNGETDYDQAYCALDFSGQGWIPPAMNASDLADGYDTRFLLSFGPMQLAPGQTDTLTLAYIGGNNIHIDPNNYSDHLRHHTSDSLSIAEYYANLDFSDLLTKADSAYSYYQHQTAIGDGDISIPRALALSQNYPNPFNAQTSITYYLPHPMKIALNVYNVLGQRVATIAEGRQPAGEYEITWDAGDFPTGVYFARLETEDRSENIKMVLLK